LQEFKKHVEEFKLTPADFGIKLETKKTGYVETELVHEHFMQLESEFPGYDYYKISKLHQYYLSHGEKSGMYSLRETLRSLTKKSQSIDDHISWTDTQRKEIIQNDKPRFLNMEQHVEVRTQQRKKILLDLLFTFDEVNKIYSRNIGTVEQPVIAVFSEQEVLEYTVEQWDLKWQIYHDKHPGIFVMAAPIAAIPITETAQPMAEAAAQPAAASEPAKKPVSMTVIGSLQPDRITELKDLKVNQEAIVKANPIVKITDAATLKTAKAQAAILLKASTAIDGKTGIITAFVKHANQLIKTGKDFLEPLAKITRDQYNEQKKLIDTWENEEEIRKTQAATAKLKKITERTNVLFAVPFGFDGQIYSVGTVYITPTQIETLTDEEFNAEVEKGKQFLLTQKSADDVKNEGIRKAAEVLRQFDPAQADELLINAGLMERPVAASPAPATASQTATAAPITQEASAPAAATTATPAATTNLGQFVPNLEYVMPDPKNKILNKFDVAHIGLLSEEPIKPAFLRARAYFIEGTKQVGLEIQAILDGENIVNGLKKSERIAELCATLLAAQ